MYRPDLHSLKSLALILCVAAVPSGCARIVDKFQPEDPAITPPRPNDSCDSAQYRRYIGQTPDVLADLVMVGPVRMIPAGSAVTMDLNPVRVNFDIDVNGVISGIWCG